MRVLILSPFEADTPTGNAVTLRRLARRLQDRGVEVRIDGVRPNDGIPRLEEALRAYRPDLLHCYHSYKTGRLVAAMRDLTLPVVVTVSGTDMNMDWEDPEKRAPIEEALHQASVVLSGSPSLHRQVLERVPEVATKLRPVPKGVELADTGYGLRSILDLKPGDFLFFLPGGVRPVKNTLFPLRPLGQLRVRFKYVKLILAGPVLDEEYGREFEAALRGKPWIKYLASIPHDRMLAAYRACDVTLNTSASEGLANTVLEAMWAGRPVLASCIPGNGDALEDGVTGMLYRDEADFTAKAEQLIREPDLRRSLGERAAEAARCLFSPDREADAVLAAYHEAVTGVH